MSTQYKVIKGGKLKKEERKEKLSQIYFRNFMKYFFTERDYKLAAFYGVKYCNSIAYNTKSEIKELAISLKYMDMVILCMENITFNELMEIFPIMKEYDKTGKYGMKEYYSTIEISEKYKPFNRKMGKVAIEFLSEYANYAIISFLSKQFATLDLYRIKALGETSMLDDFFNQIGVHPQVLVKDPETNIFYDKETGEEVGVLEEPQKPQYKIISKSQNIKEDE